MKYLSVVILIWIGLMSQSCSNLNVPFLATQTFTPTTTVTQSPTPIPTNTTPPTATATATSVPESKQITNLDAGISLIIPWTFEYTNYTTGYDIGAVHITDEDDNFNMVYANIPKQGFSSSTMMTLILMVYESKSGLVVDKSGLKYATTGILDVNLGDFLGTGFGFTGKFEGKPVAGKIIALDINEEIVLVTIGHMFESTAENWNDTGDQIFMDILESSDFSR